VTFRSSAPPRWCNLKQLATTLAEADFRRVLLTGDTVGGVWTFTLDLAEGLIAEGIEVCLATFGGAGNAVQKAQAAAIPGLRWLDSSLKLEWMDEPWNDIEKAGHWLLAVEKEFSPDVIHMNTLCHGMLDWKCPLVTTVHSCVTSWWAAVKSEPLPQIWNRYWTEVERSLNCAGLVTAPSGAMRASVIANYGVNAAATRTIHNGRKAGQFRPEAKEPLILSAGRMWDEAKNVQALIEVAPKLTWPIFLAGEQPAASVATCRALGSLSTTDLASWYGRAAIYALPARYEPFGLSALEAAMSGCALVLGDIPSLREIWRDAAIFVSPDDHRHLEFELRALIEDPERRQKLGGLALERARNYSQSKMVSRYLDAYTWARRHQPRRSQACAS
jgi:glycogen(starch) synthase